MSFVIPVKNDAVRLERAIRSILATGYRRIEIIVADNGSTDGSDRVGPAAAREAGVGCRVLSLPGRRVSELRNAGARATLGRIVAFVDADHEIGREWVESAVETLSLDGVAAAGALYHAPPGGTWVQQMYDAFRDRPGDRQPVEWLGSGNLAVRRDAFTEVGAFDTSLESCEDVDLCQRLRARGHQVVSDPRLRSVHLGDPATLGALFRQELWRGRDNLRASLRGPFSWRALPSIAIPILDLLLLAAAATALACLPLGASRAFLVAGPALLVVLALAALRAARMVRRIEGAGPREAAQALAVASVFDLARAVALVAKASYRVRRRSSAGVPEERQRALSPAR